MNWNDPEDRFRLADRVGPERYAKMHREHFAPTTLETVNGYPIRKIGSRFGPLFTVDGARVAFATLDEARTHARKLPPANPEGV